MVERGSFRRDLYYRLSVPLETAELRYLQWALAHHNGDRKSLADPLGISECTLYRKLAG